MDQPGPILFSKEEAERYSRHLILKQFGGPAQQAWRQSKILVVGMGGLGCPAALYLAAAGLGRLGLVDPDQISLSNLSRQILFTTQDLGCSKVAVAKTRLEALNPHVEIQTYPFALTPGNARDLIGAYDLILDGTDDFATRFLINRACLDETKPLISGALGAFTGQVGLFCLKDFACYRCFVPDIPKGETNCQATGVIGAMAGVIGSAMALEALKYLAKLQTGLRGHLWIYNGLETEARKVRLPKDPACADCGGQSS